MAIFDDDISFEDDTIEEELIPFEEERAEIIEDDVDLDDKPLSFYDSGELDYASMANYVSIIEAQVANGSISTPDELEDFIQNDLGIVYQAVIDELLRSGMDLLEFYGKLSL